MNLVYDVDFYKNRHNETLYAAKTIISLVLDALPPVNSAIDFGCGVGTWLYVLAERGTNKIQGLDGPWVDEEHLVIPRDCFKVTNFENNDPLDMQYDLAISLEVAEHLHSEYADGYINMLTSSSDFVLFSAAIPFQGGRGHYNEQWPDYWAELFRKRNYFVVDFIRKEIWSNKGISLWYRQNTLLFVSRKRLSEINVSNLDCYTEPLQLVIVHPEYYLLKVKESY